MINGGARGESASSHAGLTTFFSSRADDLDFCWLTRLLFLKWISGLLLLLSQERSAAQFAGLFAAFSRCHGNVLLL
jgi:hypothetical protein